MHKQGLPVEHLRAHAHLRARTNAFGATMRVRNQSMMAVHNYFQVHSLLDHFVLTVKDLGYLNIHTPIITADDCEGAGELFRVSTSEDDARSVILSVAQCKELNEQII